MKTRYILIGLLTAGSMAMAGEVTIPNTFKANTPAKAAEVNANFTAVKNAVNGNAADIATNETAISNKVSSVSGSGGISAITTGNDVVIKRADGYISVDAYAFNDKDSGDRGCYFYHGEKYFSKSSDGYCFGGASVQLPDHSRITQFFCKVLRDGAIGVDPLLMLYRMEEDTEIEMARIKIDTESTSVQTLTSSEINYVNVDNSKYTYVVIFNAGNKVHTNEEKIKVYGCHIGYTFDD